MRFPGIRLVELIEQNFRRIRVCPKEKQKKRAVTVIVGLFYYIKAPTKNIPMLVERLKKSISRFEHLI